MADFSRPEYGSYVALCRELKLERQLQVGDSQYLAAGWDPTSRAAIRVFTDCEEDGEDNDTKTDDMRIWLPSLSDWLEMLEAANASEVGIERYGSSAWCAYNLRTALEGDLAGTGPTREEAAARLWMAVRKPAEVTG